jgi:uncharacterized protein YukE
MSQMWGANIDELTQLATSFDQVAQQLTGIRSNIGGALGQASWNGPDADRARQEWSSQSVPALANAASALQQSAQTLRRAAQLQQQASAAGGISFAPGGGGGGGGSSSSSGPWGLLSTILGDAGHAASALNFLFNDFARKLPWVESGLKYLANEYPALRSILPDAAKYLGWAGDVGSVISMGTDGYQFVQDLQKYGITGVPTLESGLNTIADAAGLVPGPGWVVSGGIHAGEFIYNLDPQLDQTLHDDFWKGWDVVSTGAKNTAVNVWNTGTTDVKDVASSTWNDASKGWHALTGWM